MITFPQPRSSVLGNPWCHLNRERAKTTGLEWQSGRLFQKCVQFLKLGLTAEFSRLVWISGSVGFKKWNPRVLICWKAGVAVDSIFRRLFNQFVEGNCWIPSQKNVKCIFSQQTLICPRVIGNVKGIISLFGTKKGCDSTATSLVVVFWQIDYLVWLVFTLCCRMCLCVVRVLPLMVFPSRIKHSLSIKQRDYFNLRVLHCVRPSANVSLFFRWLKWKWIEVFYLLP